MDKIKCFIAFSGIGAQEESMKNLNWDFEVVANSEFDERTEYAYHLMHNIPLEKNKGDITKINIDKLEDFDLMTYSFPCQSFSIQGKRLGFNDEEKGNLFFDSLKIIKQKLPKIAIAENVKGLTNHNKGETLKIILKELELAGYNNYYKVLNSINYNLPQSRERIIIVSIRKDIDNGLFKFEEGKKTTKTVKDIIDFEVDRKKVKQSLSKFLNEKYFTKIYKSNYGIKKLFDGCNEKYFSSNFVANRIFSIDGTSPTLTTKNDTVFYEIKGHLTNRERFALQGFKKEYCDLLEKNGFTKGELEKFTGNTIPVNMFTSVLKSVEKTGILK